jgi:hypothetical protein
MIFRLECRPVKTVWYFYAPATKSRGGGGNNLPLSVRSPVRPFVRPDIDTWFVWLSPPTVLELQL